MVLAADPVPVAFWDVPPVTATAVGLDAWFAVV